MAAILWLKLKRMRSDVLMYAVMIVMALVLTFVFGNAVFGSSSAQRVGVVRGDMGEAATAFLDALDTPAYALEYVDEDEAAAAVAKGEMLACVMVPDGFSEGIRTGTAQLTLIKTSDSTDTMALENAIRSAAQKTAHLYNLQAALSDTLTAAGLPAPDIGEVQREYAARTGENAAVRVRISVAQTDSFDEKFAESVHYMMGFNIFFVMFSIIFTIGSILEDKKLRTWQRVRISPISGTAVLAGNFVPTFAVGAVQMAVVLFAGQMLFGIDFGSSLGPIFMVFCVFVLTSTCFGLLLAALFSTFEQLNAAAPVIIVATSMLGGCMWPLSIVPPVLQKIADFTPQRWVLEAAENLALYGGGLGGAMKNIVVLLIMAAVLFAAAMLLYNRKQRV